MAPDTIMDNYNIFSYGQSPFFCFVVKDSLKKTYSKVSVLSPLGGNRYKYRYGKNTIANERVLTKNASGKYKINNLFYTGEPYTMITEPEHYKHYSKTLYWDPPLDSNIHKIKKYLFYQAEFRDIDTGSLINKAQWKKRIDLQSSPVVLQNFERSMYFNMVAVYNDNDTSAFLNGWTKGNDGLVGIKQNNQKSRSLREMVNIRKRNNGLFIDLSQTGISEIASLYLFNPSGKKVTNFTSVDNITFSNASPLNNGSYIIQAILKDGGSITFPLTLAR